MGRASSSQTLGSSGDVWLRGRLSIARLGFSQLGPFPFLPPNEETCRRLCMYLLYLDESGGPTEIDQDYYVLGGISVHERKPYFMSKELDDLQEKWFPAATDPVE